MITFTCFECANDATFETFTDERNGREISDVLSDIFFHALEVAVIAFIVRGLLPRVVIDSVQAGRFKQGAVKAAKWTAARVEARVLVGGESYDFVTRIIKDAPPGGETKCLEFLDQTVSLGGGRWEPHYGVFKKLLTSPSSLPFSLQQHALVATVCREASVHAIDKGSYPYGQIPEWL